MRSNFVYSLIVHIALLQSIPTPAEGKTCNGAFRAETQQGQQTKRQRKGSPAPSPTPTPTPSPQPQPTPPKYYKPPVNDNDPGGAPRCESKSGSTGTYSLDRSQSDDTQSAADRATRDLPPHDRPYVYNSLVSRLESPNMIAIERNGKNITIASSRSPRITFEADGRERVEQSEWGQTVLVVASVNGDQLSVTTTGNRNTAFSVTFEPIDCGSRLRVTRRISAERLNKTVEVQSVYNRTSEVAQWNVYGGSYGSATAAGGTSGDFIIQNNTPLLAVLNTNLSTSQSRDGDHFTMTVREPLRYDGAAIEGYVSNVSRGGLNTWRAEMTLNFDRIRLPDGRTYRFAGLVQSVRMPSGEVVNVNHEVDMREDERTGAADARRSIGTSVGVVIGAIAGGGKGAAIGAAVGSGTGAGSIYVNRRSDLELATGSEVTILATSPR